MSTAVKVTVAPQRIALRPGESADVEVTIQNASPVVEHFAASVVGLPSAELFSCEPDVVKLRPKEIGNVRVKISVPERGGLVAGPYVLGVLARSPYQREVSRCEELALDVQPAPVLTMAVQPEVANGGKLGHYSVSLANEGNTPLAVTLAGSDQENQVGFEISPRELRLDPGMAAGAQITASAAPPLSGQEKRRAMMLRAHAGELVVEKPVSFVQRPRLAGGFMKVGGIAAAISLLAGATIGGALLIRDAKQPPAANTANQSQVPPNPAPGPNPTTGSPAPTTGGPAPTTGAPPPVTTTQQNNPTSEVQTAKFVNFVADVEATGERSLSNDRYSQNPGFLMAGDTQKAPPGCEDANAQAFRKSQASGLGNFLTSAKPSAIDTCNNMPIRFVFVNPAKNVRLGFSGMGAEYQIIVQYSDGKTDIRKAKSTTPVDTQFLEYEVQPGATIKSISFWHANPDPRAKDLTIIRSLGFTPA